MPKQLTTRGPVQIREFVPNDHGTEGFLSRAHAISRVRVTERGPDVTLAIYARDLPAGTIQVPAYDERELLDRLFGEVTAPAADVEAFQLLLQGFEDAIVAGDIEAKRMAWRRVMAALEAMARDLATLSALPEQGRGAA